MRILLTVDPEIPVPPVGYGGIERIVDALALEFQRAGHEVALLAHPESSCPVEKWGWPCQQSRGTVSLLSNTRRLLRTVQEWRPDIIHSFSRLAYLTPLFAIRKLGKVMSYQRHTGGGQIRWAAAMGGQSLRFTGCSEYICRMGSPFGGRWDAIHNFVDLEKYTFSSQVNDDAPLVFLGRLERIKGVHTAMEIARRSGRHIIIAGNRVEDGPGADYWEREIAPGLHDPQITYAGQVNDQQKNEILGRAAALLAPIEWDEPFGIVFAEALACGTPVITCPRGAVPEIIRHGVEGYHISSVEEGVQAVKQLNMLPRRACRERVETFFSLEVIAEKYQRLYREIIKGL